MGATADEKKAAAAALAETREKERTAERIRHHEQLLSMMDDENERLMAQLQHNKDIAAAERDRTERQRTAAQDNINANRITKKEYDDQIEMLNKIYQVQLNNNAIAQEAINNQKKKNDTLEVTNSLVDSVATKFGLSSSKAGGMLKQIWTANKGLAKTGGLVSAIPNFMKSFTKSLFTALHPLNIIESLMGAIFKESWELFGRFSVELSKMNAAIGDAGATAKAAGAAIHYGMGVEIEEATAAASGLAGTFTKFTSMSTQAKTGLIRMGAELERVGMGAGATGQGMNTLMKAMGKTTKEGIKAWKGLAVSASSYGKTVPQMGADFAAVSGVLMSHGPKMMKVFKDLQATAMATGLATDKLMSIAAKFDTFDSAAASVGNLNALLGGDYLNTLEMMNMTENERIQNLKSSLELSGKSFDQMERFERKAVAEAMAMDEGQLAQMMNSSNREARKARIEAKRKEKDQKAYNKMIKSTVDIFKALKMLFTSLFANTGLMQAFSFALGKLFEHMKVGSPLGDGIRRITKFIGDLMGKAIVGVIEWLEKWMGTGDDLEKKIAGWETELKSYFGEWESGERSIKKSIEDITKAIKEYILEFTGMGDIFEEGGIQSNLMKGADKLAKMFEGDTFKKLQTSIKNFVAKPLGEIFASLSSSFDQRAKDASIFDPFEGAALETGASVMGALAEGLGQESPKLKREAEIALMSPMKAAFTETLDWFGINSASKKMEGLGNDLQAGLMIGLGGEKGTKTPIEIMFDRLIESTDAWTESLEEAASAAGNVAAAVAGGAAGGGGGGSRIKLELDGEVLAEYILDTVKGTMRREARG